MKSPPLQNVTKLYITQRMFDSKTHQQVNFEISICPVLSQIRAIKNDVIKSRELYIIKLTWHID